MNGRFSGTLPGQEPEGRLLTVTGTTGAGKTMAVDRLLTRDREDLLPPAVFCVSLHPFRFRSRVSAAVCSRHWDILY